MLALCHSKEFKEPLDSILAEKLTADDMVEVIENGREALSLIILLDQLARNVYRGTSAAKVCHLLLVVGLD